LLHAMITKYQQGFYYGGFWAQRDAGCCTPLAL
jgi:hypothetical protein